MRSWFDQLVRGARAQEAEDAAEMRRTMIAEFRQAERETFRAGPPVIKARGRVHRYAASWPYGTNAGDFGFLTVEYTGTLGKPEVPCGWCETYAIAQQLKGRTSKWLMIAYRFATSSCESDAVLAQRNRQRVCITTFENVAAVGSPLDLGAFATTVLHVTT